MKTTLNKIRSHSPCADGWEKLLKHLGKTHADDEELAILTILDSNGLDDALWCLRAVDGYEREMRLFAVWCARQVQHLMTDQRSIDALEVAERYANGEATNGELNAASAAAWAAASAAAWSAASEAASASAYAAAYAADYDADYAAASAAKYVASAAAWAAAYTADYTAAKSAQEVEFRRILKEVMVNNENTLEQIAVMQHHISRNTLVSI
jgi:hypothetical protein